jgi:Protein of unknown function (DUF2924)
VARPRTRTGTDDVAIEAIADLSRDQLIERWAKSYKRPPPKGISRTLLERSAAYQAQVQMYGGLDVTTRRALRGLLATGEQRRAVTPAKAAKPCLEPGMRLVREWNGRTYSVDVIEGGFVWDGKVHKSLTAIARKITGARWSGPRFFGL